MMKRNEEERGKVVGTREKSSFRKWLLKWYRLMENFMPVLNIAISQMREKKGKKRVIIKISAGSVHFPCFTARHSTPRIRGNRKEWGFLE